MQDLAKGIADKEVLRIDATPPRALASTEGMTGHKEARIVQGLIARMRA